MQTETMRCHFSNIRSIKENCVYNNKCRWYFCRRPHTLRNHWWDKLWSITTYFSESTPAIFIENFKVQLSNPAKCLGKSVLGMRILSFQALGIHFLLSITASQVSCGEPHFLYFHSRMFGKAISPSDPEGEQVAYAWPYNTGPWPLCLVQGRATSPKKVW